MIKNIVFDIGNVLDRGVISENEIIDEMVKVDPQHFHNCPVYYNHKQKKFSY